MKWVVGILLLLLACSQTPEPVMAPPTQVVLAGCEATLEIGEQCSQTCECLLPGECINDICSLTQLEDDKPCIEHEQCLRGYCTQQGTCGGPDAPTTTFICENECEDGECYTACRRR